MLVNSAALSSSPAPVPFLWSARHLKSPNRTTVKLENLFWEHIEVVAKNGGVSWREWVETALSAKPVGVNAASWLRVNCLLCASHFQPLKESYGEKITTT